MAAARGFRPSTRSRATCRRPPRSAPTEGPGEVFGSNVFTKAVMCQAAAQGRLQVGLATIDHSAPLDPAVADVVAAAMKDWAMEKGATHYAHVFYPLTGFTAEKHDSFLEPGGDGSAIAEFAGKTLVQGEPDASSLPQRWPAFDLRGARLHRLGRDLSRVHPRERQRQHAVHPDGLRVDDRRRARPQDAAAALAAGDGRSGRAGAPAVRAREARRRRVVRRRRAGVLPDRPQLLLRPARPAQLRPHPVRRASPPKGQEFDDHYFGAIPERVLGYMLDCERELFKLGIPAKTRHNEVAPGQFEIAPDLRAGQRRRRPPAAADDDAQEGRAQARHGVPVPREAVRRHQRLGQARQLLARQRDRGQPAAAGRHPARERAVPGLLRAP